LVKEFLISYQRSRDKRTLHHAAIKRNGAPVSFLALRLARVRQARDAAAGCQLKPTADLGATGTALHRALDEPVWFCCEWFFQVTTAMNESTQLEQRELGDRSCRRAASRCSCGDWRTTSRPITTAGIGSTRS